MWVRGAPLIGVTAAFGIACHMKNENSDAELQRGYETLLSARPTAVNLRFALDKMLKALKVVPNSLRFQKGYQIANKLRENELKISTNIGEFGSEIIKKLFEQKKRTINILTHCNAGWLATVDFGTATAPIYCSQKKKRGRIK